MRYHSLSGDETTLPECLEITSKTANGIIMGVRHKTYTIEGIQFHPESVLADYGLMLFRNFLSLTRGTWSEQAISTDKINIPFTASLAVPFGISETVFYDTRRPETQPSTSILDRIKAQRVLDVRKLKTTPGRTLRDLQAMIDLHCAPPPNNFKKRLLAGARNGRVSVIAEFKRASPSKGVFDATACAAVTCREYASAGAAAVSVLVEPIWFRGSIQDLADARAALATFCADRPSVLLKDFVVDTYQIIQARLAGADAILLIVAILSKKELTDYLALSASLGMQCLVEVNNAQEMAIAHICSSRRHYWHQQSEPAHL